MTEYYSTVHRYTKFRTKFVALKKQFLPSKKFFFLIFLTLQLSSCFFFSKTWNSFCPCILLCNSFIYVSCEAYWLIFLSKYLILLSINQIPTKNTQINTFITVHIILFSLLQGAPTEIFDMRERMMVNIFL